MGMDAQNSTQMKVADLRGRIQEALRSQATGSGATFNALVQSFFSEEEESGLHCWVVALTQCVSSLVPGVHDGLVRAVLKVDLSLSEEVHTALHQFLLNLVSSNNTYAVTVYDTLVRNFLPIPDADEETAGLVRARTHKLLERLLNICPTSSSSLLTIIADKFPHRRRDAEFQTAFLSNILAVADYWPILREKILAIVIDKLIQIDVEIKLEEVVEEEEGLLFEVDVDEPGLVSEQVAAEQLELLVRDLPEGPEELGVEETGEAEEGELEKVDVTADKLDRMMMIMFNYLHRKCDESPQTSDEIFVLLRGFFYKSVLHTHRSKYTQFLLFYMTSLRPRYPEMFLGHMHQKLFATSEANVTRMTCAAYVGSFLARATWLDASTVVLSLSLLLRWLNQYLSKVEDGYAPITAPNPEAHSVFYSVCQSVFYVICYKFELLWKTESGRSCLRDGNLTRIVHSGLNPLKVCLDSVVGEFARVSFALNLVDCYEVIRHNRAVLLAGRSMYGTEPQLEMFFPFDPYLLKESSVFIKEIYQSWAKPNLAVAPDLDSEESDAGYNTDSESEANENEDDDDEDDEVGAMGESFSKSFSFDSHAGSTAMDLQTPPTAHFLNSRPSAITAAPTNVKRSTSTYF